MARLQPARRACRGGRRRHRRCPAGRLWPRGAAVDRDWCWSFISSKRAWMTHSGSRRKAVQFHIPPLPPAPRRGFRRRLRTRAVDAQPLEVGAIVRTTEHERHAVVDLVMRLARAPTLLAAAFLGEDATPQSRPSVTPKAQVPRRRRPRDPSRPRIARMLWAGLKATAVWHAARASWCERHQDGTRTRPRHRTGHRASRASGHRPAQRGRSLDSPLGACPELLFT